MIAGNSAWSCLSEYLEGQNFEGKTSVATSMAPDERSVTPTDLKSQGFTDRMSRAPDGITMLSMNTLDQDFGSVGGSARFGRRRVWSSATMLPPHQFNPRQVNKVRRGRCLYAGCVCGSVFVLVDDDRGC